MQKLKVGNWFMLMLALTPLSVSSVSRADSAFDKCGEREDKVRAEIEREVQKQFNAMEYQARNAAALNAVIKAAKQDLSANDALQAMQGKPNLDNDTRLRYNDLLVTLMHEKKLANPKALVSCPDHYVVDESTLHLGLWQPDEVQPGRSRQGLSDSADMPNACKYENPLLRMPSTAPLVSTSVMSGLSDSMVVGARQTDPLLIAITSVNRPVTVKFRGKKLVLNDLGVMAYLHFKDGAIEEVQQNIYLHDHSATFDGHEIELESWVDNELLPQECKDFHYSKGADGGSTTGGAIENQDDTTSSSKKQKTATQESGATSTPAI